jgi:hypothetical protein
MDKNHKSTGARFFNSKDELFFRYTVAGFSFVILTVLLLVFQSNRLSAQPRGLWIAG